MSRWKKALRYGGLALLAGTGLVAVSVVGFVAFLWTEPGNRFIGRQAESLIGAQMSAGTVRIGAVHTDLSRHLVLENVVIFDEQGRPVVQVGSAKARYRLFPLLGGTLAVDTLDVQSVYVDLDMESNGVLDLMRLFGQTAPAPASEEPYAGLPIDLSVESIVLDGGHVIYRNAGSPAVGLSGLSARGRLESVGNQLDVRDLTVTGLLASPGPLSLRLEGALSYNPEGFHLDQVSAQAPGVELLVSGTAGDEQHWGIEARKLELAGFEPLAGGVGLGGNYTGQLRVDGPLDRLGITGRLQGEDGARGSLIPNLEIDATAADIGWKGTLDADGFHVEDAYTGLTDQVALTGTLDVKGSGVVWPNGIVADVGWNGPTIEAYGQTLREGLAQIHLENGVVSLSETSFDGVVGKLTAAGDIDTVNGPMSLRVTGSLDPRRLAELGVEGMRGSGYIDARITGDLQQADSPIRVRGSATLRRWHYESEVYFERLEAAYDVTVAKGDTHVEVAAEGQGSRLYGLDSALVSLPDLVVDYRGSTGDVELDGTATLTESRYGELAELSTTGVRFDVGLPAKGPQRVNADVHLGEYDIATFPGDTGAVFVKVRGDEVEFQLGLDSWGRRMVQTQGDFNLKTQRLHLPQLELKPTARLEWRSVEPVVLILTEAGVRDAAVVLDGSHGDVELRGQMGQVGPLHGSVALQDFQLDVIAELFPAQASGLSGRGDLVIGLEGTGAAPRVTGELDLQGVWVDGVMRWADLEGSFVAEGQHIKPRIEVGVNGDPLLNVAGSLPAKLNLAEPGLNTAGLLDLSLALRPGSFERFERLLVDPPELPKGKLSAVLEAHGPMRDPEFRLAGVAEVNIRGWRTRSARTEFDVRRQGSMLDLYADLREGLTQRATVGGAGETRMGEVFTWALEGGAEPDWSDYTLWMDNLAFSAVMLGVPVESLVLAAEVPIEASGELVGGFTVFGSPLEPQIEGGLHWLDGTLAKVAHQGGYFNLYPGEEVGYTVDAGLTFAEGGLSLQGDVPVAVLPAEADLKSWSRGDLDLKLTGSGIPLALLSTADPQIRGATGNIELDGEVGGPIHKPEPELSLAVHQGRLQYPPLGLRVSDLEVQLEADDRRVKLQKLDAQTKPIQWSLQSGSSEATRPSKLSVVGSAQLEEWVPTKMSGKIDLDEAWVLATTDRQIRLDGGLLVSGEWPNLHVDGELDLAQGRMVYDSASWLEAAPLEPVEMLVINRSTGGLSEDDEEEEAPPFYADFDVDVGLDLKRNLEVQVAMPFIDDLGALGAAVTRADLSARIGGNLAVFLDQGKPAVTGEVDIVGGKVRVLSSRFEIEDSKIVFAGDEISNPALDVTAQMSLDGATVVMSARGTAEEPEVEFSCAEYPDQTQIMTMLLTGRSPEDAGSASDTAAALAGLLANSVLGGTNFGSFNIDPDGAVRVGVPVAQGLYFSSVIKPSQNLDDNSVSASLEWLMAPRLVAEGGVGDTFQWADLFWEIRF